MAAEFENKHVIKSVNIDDQVEINQLKILEIRKEVAKAGKFLKASGISDAVTDFKMGFLGEMGNLRNEIKIDEAGFSSSASIVLEWIDPDDFRHLILTVSAGCSDHKERYISANFKEIPHYKVNKYDPPLLKISLLPLGKDFSFESSISRNKKTYFKRWLREKILNSELVWGED